MRVELTTKGGVRYIVFKVEQVGKEPYWKAGKFEGADEAWGEAPDLSDALYGAGITPMMRFILFTLCAAVG